MQVIGIIAEYNPFHSGHRHQIQEIRRHHGKDCAIVCAMSGNWVQRGDAALLDKWQRSALALGGGADLILELPTPWALSSAEGFARGGVGILAATGIVEQLSFGCESRDVDALKAAASCLDTEAFSVALKQSLEKGLSFPVARQQAVEVLIGSQAAACMKTPNNNLGIEYIRALKHHNSSISLFPIPRLGSGHHSLEADREHASASFLRQQLLAGIPSTQLAPFLDPQDAHLFAPASFTALHFAQRAVFARLRTMKESDFLALPDCTEGLHHRLYQAALTWEDLDTLYQTVKSRRYTHSRIRRLVLAAFLELQETHRSGPLPYLRVLGMNKRGQTLLRQMKQRATLPILTKAAHIHALGAREQELFALEARCTDLYALCRRGFGDGKGKQEYRQNPVIV